MALITVTSTFNNELHLVRGRDPYPGLIGFLRLIDSSEPNHRQSESNYRTKYIKGADTLTIVFRPLFINGTVSGSAPAQTFTGNGMTVDMKDGIITLDAAAPATESSNFILGVFVDETIGGTTTSRVHYYRVHIHHDITHAWLTPNPIAVPRDIDEIRCSVYAQFDDGIIADMTNGTSVDITYTISPNVDADGNLKALSTDVDGNLIDIAAEITYGASKKITATGKMTPHTPSPALTLLAGPGTATINGGPAAAGVPNILIIPDGFANNLDDDSLDKFTEPLSKMITEIRKPMYAPLDLLLQENAINIWYAPIASHESGLTYKNELYIKDGKARGIPSVTPIKSVYPTDLTHVLDNTAVTDPSDVEPDHAWRLGHMFFILGMPMLAHVSMTPDQIRTWWKARLGLPPALIDTVPDDSIEVWKKMGDRRLMNERSSFLGNYSGNNIRVPFNDDGTDNDLYNPGKFRFSRDKMDTFLAGLQFNGTTIGNYWEYMLGKDYDLLVFFLNGFGGREQNSDGYFYVNARTGNSSPPPFEIEDDPAQPGTRAFRPTLAGAHFDKPELLAEARNTFVHEAAHSFTLGDEYGEYDIPYTGTVNAIENDSSNLQAKAALELVGGGMDFWKVKWRWHRMEKCRVLNAAITTSGTGSGTQYNITLVPLQTDDAANRFKAGEEVILRFRELRHPLHRDVLHSPLMKVEADESGDMLKLTVKNSDLYNPLPAGYSFPTIETAFGKDCILYLPKKAPEHAASSIYQYAEVTGLNVIHHMVNKNKPLTPEPCVKNTEKEQMPELDDILDLSDTFSPSSCCSCGSKIANRVRITGLYSGGELHYCGVYHPTGHCMMRSHNLAEFCPVCKYILTEVLHPELHPKVDKYIQEFYPI